MTLGALILILAAAFIHASWNLLNKRASGHVTFTWLAAFLSAIFYTPVSLGVIFVTQYEIGIAEVVLMAGSAVLHSAYFILLNQGYRIGDLSLVYPLARGTGPLLSSLAAILLLGERPSPLALSGALMIIAGVVVLTISPKRFGQSDAKTAVVYALVTGLFIAAYTLWDKQAVSRFAVPPLILDWGSNLGRAIFLTVLPLRYPEEIRAEWRAHRYEAIGVAVLAPLSYILVLTAMQFTPVSYVAPAREISILIGTAMGTRLLAEGDGRRRLVAASAMVLGVVALAVG
jgi:drug/metabolite transporter (DMT)-like permease